MKWIGIDWAGIGWTIEDELAAIGRRGGEGDVDRQARRAVEREIEFARADDRGGLARGES